MEDNAATTDADEGWDAIAAAHGSARLGALQPYIAQSVEEVYDLPRTANGTTTAGAKLSTVTTTTAVDAWGNPTTITATTEDHANSKRFRQVTANTYGSDDRAQQFGRLTKTVVTRTRNETANDDNYDAKLTASRTSTFSYYTDDDHRQDLLKTAVREAIPDKNGAIEIPAHTTTYDYDAFGNRVQAAVAAGGKTRCETNTVEYDTYGRFVVLEKDCLGRPVRRMRAYNKHGLPVQSERVVDVDKDNSSAVPTVVRTAYSYTPGGRLYFSRAADGAYTGTVWKTCGAGCPTGAQYYIETRQPGNGTAGRHRISREYRDALGRVVRRRTKGFAEDAWISADTAYDPLGRVARQSEPYHAVAARHWTSYSYDLLGRVVRTELPDYQAGSGGVNSVMTVSYAGLTATTTNGKSQRQVETRNALDEVIRTADHEGTTVTHAYDAWGQVTSTTTSGTGVSPVVVAMAYDDRGRRTETTDPDRGRWTYAYNGFDELVRQTDAVKNVQALTYDGLGRVLTRTDTGGTQTVTATWTYDPANGLGQLQQVTDGTYTRTHTYDSLGRPDTTTHKLGTDGTYYSRQTWDAYGRVHQVFDAARERNTAAAWTDNVTEVQYNRWGYAYKWVDGVHLNDAPRKTYREITSQDARGNVTGERLGGKAVRTARTFNAKTGRIESITGRDVMGGTIQALTYEWDLVGNLTGRGETSVGKTLTETFAYDDLNRLTSAQVTGRTPQAVTYDALGNIKSKTGVGAYTYGSTRPHAVTRAGTDRYTYDANGNQLTGAGRTLTYTPFNKVVSIEKGMYTTAFVYGPDRARYKRTDVVRTGSGTSTTTTLYLGNAEKVIAPDGSYTYKRYVADGVLIEQTHDNTDTRTGEDTRYLLYDHLGSVDVIADNTGAAVQDMSFDAWGQRRAPDDWTVLALMRLKDTGHGSITPYGFTGHEMLDAVGIIHMNGRIYDPRLGRFMQADPVIQFPDYSQSWNRYSYVLNNPLNATDPTGYILGTIGGIIGGAIGFITCGYACAVKGAAIGAGLGASADVLIRGGNLGQALLSGVSAAAFTYAGGRLFPIGGPFEKVLLYGLQMGVIGGITTTLQGGNFGHGFVAAGTAALVGGTLARSDWFRGLKTFGRLVTSTVAGGTVSRITGGKFANGAMTGAFASLVNSAAQAAAQRSSLEGLSPAEFEERFGMTWEESRSRYESSTEAGEPFPLTKQDALRLFTDDVFAQKQLIAHENLDTVYRNILNIHAADSIAAASTGGYVRQPWYKNLFHNPLQYTKWVGPNGHFEVVFNSKGGVVTALPYKGTFNFFSPADVSGHWKADVVTYIKRHWGN